MAYLLEWPLAWLFGFLLSKCNLFIYNLLGFKFKDSGYKIVTSIRLIAPGIILIIFGYTPDELLDQITVGIEITSVCYYTYRMLTYPKLTRLI